VRSYLQERGTAVSHDNPINIHTYADNRTEITVHTKAGMLLLEISPGGRVAVPHPERAERLRHRFKYRLVFGLEANDILQGWYVSEERDPPDSDRLVRFATKKKRRPKPEPM
jgi:hypothetical protein